MKEERERKGEEAVYLTTPIYYVNDKPHIGHAYTTIAADVLARFHRSLGRHVFFLTGVDEHGQKVEKAARARGISPQDHCDEMAPRFAELWKRLCISNDAFIRTTDPRHKRIVQEALRKLHERNLIVQRDFEGWYCTPCERYWTEKDAPDSTCPDCRRPLELLKEKNYFFLMSRYAGRIRKAVESGEMEIIPASRKNEVLGFLEQGLGDLCISRPKKRLSWGVPLPFDEDYVTYVWFDALLNYVSGPQFLGESLARSAGIESWWPAYAHLIGKDILTTHCVYWPAMLSALDIPLPRRVVAHGWWNFSGEKMSKSRGNVVDPLRLFEEYGGEDERCAVDAFRYFVVGEVTFGLDGTFSLEAFERRWTANLSNDIGNLYSRFQSLTGKILGGAVNSVPVPEDAAVMERYREAMESFRFHDACSEAVAFARTLNQYIQERAPWSHREEAPSVLARVAAGLRILTVLLHPMMPRSMALAAERIGLRDLSLKTVLEPFPAVVTKGAPIFPRPHRRAPDGPAEKKSVPAEKTEREWATLDDVKKLDLKIAVVKQAERVKGADRLLKLNVDLGREERTIVAGIAESYAPEELVGRRIVLAANLKPARIRGIESQGMLLAAPLPTGRERKLSLITTDGEPEPGAEVR
ncbi:MAG: methionine--tRNA ligase [Candidatus Hydrogenedentota bacterium]|nr:MAG: methionine--tRNA ligase [Candidatus Hydrogenedentota bacterium]